MKVRSFCLAAILLIGLAVGSTTSKANGTPSGLISNGRIVYDNKTPEDAGDDIVIYDSDDLKALETKIRALESRMAQAEIEME